MAMFVYYRLDGWSFEQHIINYLLCQCANISTNVVYRKFEANQRAPDNTSMSQAQLPIRADSILCAREIGCCKVITQKQWVSPWQTWMHRHVTSTCQLCGRHLSVAKLASIIDNRTHKRNNQQTSLITPCTHSLFMVCLWLSIFDSVLNSRVSISR